MVAPDKKTLKKSVKSMFSYLVLPLRHCFFVNQWMMGLLQA